jgi:hypothetical protein
MKIEERWSISDSKVEIISFVERLEGYSNNVSIVLLQERIWSKLEYDDKKAIKIMSKYLKIIWIISMIICPIGHLSYESYIPVILNSEVGSTQKMIKISLEVQIND